MTTQENEIEKKRRQEKRRDETTVDFEMITEQ